MDRLTGISELQNKINTLQAENRLLRDILDRSNIPYIDELRRLSLKETSEAYDENQGGRIVHPKEITKEMANRFYARFWGRTDVYAKRSINRKTGKSGYYPQCDNFWRDNICAKKTGQKIKCADCRYKQNSTLEIKAIIAHLTGNKPDGSDVVGVYPLLPNGTCRFLVFDFDNHDIGAEERDFANTDEEWRGEVDAMRQICEMNGMDVLVERSRSGKGAHIWLFFEKPIPAALARRFGFALLEKGAEYVNLKSFKYYDRMLPAQDVLPEGGTGTLIALPLQKQALLKGNSAFIDKNWNAYPDQWDVLFSKPRLSQEYLEVKIREWSGANVRSEDGKEKPWERDSPFSAMDAPKGLNIVLSNGIYVETDGIQAALLNKIRRLAAFGNQSYFRNRAMGLSNMGKGSWIYLGEDVDGYVHIPAGCMDSLMKKCEEAHIPMALEDKRCLGRNIRVEFTGELKTEQKTALMALKSYDNGILSAATAFGKTVVCSAMIAERKVNTLILIQASSLIEQWVNSIGRFLLINEELPEYETKTGRIRKRKSVVGLVQGAHDSTTGIIDIAMAESFYRKGKLHPRIGEYGMVLVDECQHVAADTLAAIMSNIKARYVYGVTATPMRSDGLEKVNFMLLGPIRHSYTSKERAESQNIHRYVRPRFTRSVAARGFNEKMHPNEAYEIVRNDRIRDEQIVRDVISCIEEGRTPVILSRYRDHSERLHKLLEGYANHVFLLMGGGSRKEHRRIREEMDAVPDGETVIIVATGTLIGEGFDYPRLDTLIMATPVSFRGVVEQFVGRLEREYPGKEEIIVYDYVDSHIPIFDRMYAKRLRAYKQIGYEISGDTVKQGKRVANAIFDIDNYREVYSQDLSGATGSIIISSPALSGMKVGEVIKSLKGRQEAGVKITVVTWYPDSYGYGRSDYWMELHEEMRRAGIVVQLVDKFCEHYTIVDDEIVWYGSMNFLSKEDAEDNLMRVESKEIANELKELTFGNEEGPERLF